VISFKWAMTAGMALVAALAGFGFAVRSAQREKAQKYDKEATVVSEGSMTSQQKERSRIYKRTKPGTNLVDMADRHGGQAAMIRKLPWWSDEDEGSEIASYDQYLNKLACRSDTVVRGMIRQKSSQLTEEKDFVFTDYELSVEEVLKNSSSGAISPYDFIVVNRPGGTVNFSGRIIHVRDEMAQPLEVGARYVLLLRFVPEAKVYQTLRGKGVFLLREDQVFETSERKMPSIGGAQREESAFITQLRSAIAISCDKSDKKEK
jgi:hypothetical protein